MIHLRLGCLGYGIFSIVDSFHTFPISMVVHPLVGSGPRQSAIKFAWGQQEPKGQLLYSVIENERMFVKNHP